MRIILAFIVVCFVVFCGWLVAQSGLIEAGRPPGPPCMALRQIAIVEKTGAANASSTGNEQSDAANFTTFEAYGGSAQTIILGSTNPDSSFKSQWQLSTKGAAIEKATFSEFDDRDYKAPRPLVILSPVKLQASREVLSLANRELVFVKQGQQLPLHKLHWKSLGKKTADDGSQTARFEANIKDPATSKEIMKLIKNYKVSPGSYLLDCTLTVENLSSREQQVRFNLAGPVGIGREGLRRDMRKVIAGFQTSPGQITSVRLDKRKLTRARTPQERRLNKPGADFLWAAVANKYFAAILVPLPQQGKDYCDWVLYKTGRFYNPDRDTKADSGDETMGLDLEMAPVTLAPTGQKNHAKTYNFQLYLGPKDKSLFDKNPLYRRLSFVQTIDFLPCFCCPASIINPIAFAILGIMSWMYGIIGNYGVVIIILVFLVRLAMHPVTRKSQLSMSKMSKLTPQAEEIRKKYANNKAEMNKQLMALYRQQGASPIMGMLPMFVQMPIWIALYSAIYASIKLRGAAFLPFWITDLSVPDALFRFSAINLPLFGKLDSFNLLPILMGVAFYLQQKLMPSQTPATNPQVAQQQKIMMIIFPVMFPLLLYKAPSGLNLYIMTSVFAGAIEQHVIRKHIREKEQAESKGLVAATSKTGGKVKKKKPKPFYKF